VKEKAVNTFDIITDLHQAKVKELVQWSSDRGWKQVPEYMLAPLRKSTLKVLHKTADKFHDYLINYPELRNENEFTIDYFQVIMKSAESSGISLFLSENQEDPNSSSVPSKNVQHSKPPQGYIQPQASYSGNIKNSHVNKSKKKCKQVYTNPVVTNSIPINSGQLDGSIVSSQLGVNNHNTTNIHKLGTYPHNSPNIQQAIQPRPHSLPMAHSAGVSQTSLGKNNIINTNYQNQAPWANLNAQANNRYHNVSNLCHNPNNSIPHSQTNNMYSTVPVLGNNVNSTTSQPQTHVGYNNITTLSKNVHNSHMHI